MKRLLFSAAAAALAVASFATNGTAGAQTATPPPPPPAPNATAAPILPPGALPTPAGSTIQLTLPTPKPGSSATPAPPKDVDANRVGISGVWEVAIQQPNTVEYTHFKLQQKGNVLTGQYLDASGKKYPLAGSVDGKNVRVVVSMPNGTALIFNGSQEAGMDMVGTLDTTKDVIGFTASYRPKYKWIDNLTPGGGMGNGIP